MKIKPKAYPHPVLSEFSDDISSAITCDIKHSQDKLNFYFNYEFSIDNQTIVEMIRARKADIVFHIECGKTFFRQIYRADACNFADGKFIGKVELPAYKINGNTAVSVFVCASSSISDYKPEMMHADYGNCCFNIENGDFAAVEKTRDFPLFQDYDPIVKAESIISFQRDTEKESGNISLDFESDKIVARLPKDMHQIYIDLSGNKTLEDPVVSILAVPVLMDGLSLIRELIMSESGADIATYRERRWFRSLEKKLLDLQVDIKTEDSMFTAAQKILENPCIRAGRSLQKNDDNTY